MRRGQAKGRRRCSHGHAVERATVRQKKTGQPVRFEMTEQTREAVDSYIAAAHKKPGEFLFGSRRGRDQPITTRQYSRLVGQWIVGIGLDPTFFGTHSLRRTKATLIYRRTTQRSHISSCKRFAAWLKRSPDAATPERGRKTRTTEARDHRRGIPQGSPLSPLLANIYMRRFVLGWKKLGLELY